MNKELEEAITKLKRDISKPLACGDITIVCIDDLETVLKALDNSIPKEVIENKLNDIEDMIDKTTRGELQKYTVRELILHRKIYNELLEGK